MAAPTAPTLTSITTEGLKAVLGTAPSAELTRAQDNWMEQIKNDIHNVQRKLKSLQSVSVQTLTKGLGKYSNPSDFSSDLQMDLMTGTQYGTAQTGSTSSVTLAADEDLNDDDVVGREIVIYTGTGANQIAYCTAYNNSTKVATISPSFSTAPDSSSGYLIVSSYTPLSPKPITDLSSMKSQTATGEPYCFYPLGDEDNGEFILYPTFYRTDSQPYVVKQRYYANLMKLDLDGTLISTLYQRWRNVFLTGVKWKASQNFEDNRETSFFREYLVERDRMIASETYGHDLSNLTASVVDYGV